MALHLIKLCVGVDTIRELDEWIAERMAQKKKKKEAIEHIHTTRMMPSQKDELLDGGSLYWVIKGMVSCRQKLIDLRQFTDKEGVKRKSTRVRCDRVVLLGSGGRGAPMDRGGSGGGDSAATHAASEPSEPLTDDDIPF